MPIRPLAWWARSGGLRGGVAQSGAAEGGAAWGGVGRRGGASGGWPLVVLVDEQSASAAEVFAGALRASGEAVIVGTRTFGKGASQALTYMSDGSALRFTVYTCLSWSQPNLLPQLELNQTLDSAGTKSDYCLSWNQPTGRLPNGTPSTSLPTPSLQV